MRSLTFGLLLIMALWAVGCRHSAPLKEPTVQRYGSVIGLKEDTIDYYKKLHANPWPGVLETIRDCNIRNYSIYLHKMDNDKYYLFSYFEYTGDDFEADMEKMAADPITQKWWKETDPCQFPVEHRAEDEWWAHMEEVFHCP